MVQKRVALPAAGVGVALAGGLAGNRMVARWRRNPDPLGGRRVAFPDGEQRFVTMPDGAKISTVTVGEGPTIVCVHGLTANRHDWGPMAPALLDAGYQLVAIEQRGHGDSTPGSAGYGSAQLGRDLAAVFEALDIRAAALMGHSMGGMAIMGFATQAADVFAQRVESMVLIATAASLQTRRHGVALWAGGIPIPAALVPESQRLRLGAGLGVFGAAPSLHMVDEVIRQFEMCPEDVRNEATAALADHDVRGQLGGLAVPSLVAGGSRDLLISAAQVAELASELDDAELHMFDGAGHMVLWERHEEISELVVEMLSTQSASVSDSVAPDLVQ